MLKERIKISGNGFKIKREGSDPERRAFYAKFFLYDEEADKSQARPAAYWDANNDQSHMIERNSFIYVWEEKDGVEIESCSFYISGGNAKPKLRWSIERDRRYGDDAYMITLKWVDHTGEKIHKKHIWLKDEQSGRKYRFLKEYIEPDEKEEERYIIDVLPGTADVRHLMIEGDDVLQQKYLIERQR